jgi:hypothetical protein
LGRGNSEEDFLPKLRFIWVEGVREGEGGMKVKSRIGKGFSTI